MSPDKREVADRGGSGVLPVSNGLTRRTAPETPFETSQQSAPLSNYVPHTSQAVKFVVKCIAALDEYDIEELANEIWNEADQELADKLREESSINREVYGSKSLFAEVAEEYRRNRADDPHPEIECDLPDFDDPDFLTKLHTDNAPLADRKQLFVRLWNGFENEDKRAFMSRVDPNGVFRQVAA
ncbi:hypothetical protein [Sedimentitalea nanhaiensis]|uniref:hypothetical protein n=1 Tax=Sedimentitalea nanhaiensis TaxID=999627 RepID=UPI001113AC51|nr:hypothetical protein [Sedimentitalea nanhaiensis]